MEVRLLGQLVRAVAVASMGTMVLIAKLLSRAQLVQTEMRVRMGVLPQEQPEIATATVQLDSAGDIAKLQIRAHWVQMENCVQTEGPPLARRAIVIAIAQADLSACIAKSV